MLDKLLPNPHNADLSFALGATGGVQHRLTRELLGSRRPDVRRAPPEPRTAVGTSRSPSQGLQQGAGHVGTLSVNHKKAV